MKFTVLSTNCVFDESKGTTTYTLTVGLKPGPIDLYDQEINRLIEKHGFDHLGIGTFTGIAHLKPQDTWDQTYGRRVAEAKCHRKLFLKISMLNIAITDYVLSTLEGGEDSVGDIQKYLGALSNEQKHLMSLCDGSLSSTTMSK